MAAHYVLLLDAQGLRAYRLQGGAMKLDAEFAADANGHAALAAYLAGHRGCVCHLLVNVAEEGFHAEEIPHLRGRDRKVVIQRKLHQTFSATPFACALPQERAAEGRRDERVLLMSLTRPQLIEPWLEIFARTEALLAGLVSLPQVLANLAWVRTQARCLLVTATRGGLRLSFFTNGHLRFSRLTPWNAETHADDPATYASAAAKLLQYLAGQRLVARDATLPVFVLVPSPQLDTWRKQFHDTEALRFECLDSAADDDAQYAQLLLRHRPRQQFAPEPSRRPFRLWQVKRALSATSAAICVACLAFAAFQLAAALRLGEESAGLRARNEAAAGAWRATREMQASTPRPVAQLRDFLARHDELLRGSPAPAPLLRRLGAALGDFPQIELESLDWGVAHRFEDDGAGPFAVIDIAALLPPETANDPRGQLAIVDALGEKLRADPTLRVRVTDTAFDAASGKVMRGGGDETGVPRFSLRVAQKL